MKYLKLFERFTQSTLTKNNRVYHKYFTNYKDYDRSGVVAWEVESSQEDNWDLINRYIKNGDSVLDYGCGIGDFVSYIKKKRKKLSNYTGVDINPEFIQLAKSTYPNNDFQLIKNIDELPNQKYDVVFASGVFTWFITKRDFIKAMHKLYSMAGRELLLTFNYDEDEDYKSGFWTKNYREYNENLFPKLFPDWKIEHKINKRYLLVRIIK